MNQELTNSNFLRYHRSRQPRNAIQKKKVFQTIYLVRLELFLACRFYGSADF